MAIMIKRINLLLLYDLFFCVAVNGFGLSDIDHVIVFMQENRAFDHYFGTMAGVRGFNDANLQMNNGAPVWKQPLPSQTDPGRYVMPWYLNYLGGNWTEATQFMVAGSNSWRQRHAALNHGANDHWASENEPWSLGYYKQEDIPTQWALAENWIVGDMYQESVIASTAPNRATWASGSINVPGGPQAPDMGGNPYIDNNEIPGCHPANFNCYPLKWKTAAELYEAAGVSWQVYQDKDNFDDNPFAWFAQYQNAPVKSNLNKRGLAGLPLDHFVAQAASGTLPEISYIIGPTELSEHPPYSPRDGAWLQDKVVKAVTESPKYHATALIISYDESGGWYDHLTPYRSPEGTAGEWIDDPYHQAGYTFTGPGFRLPFYIISPWTRKGGVYTAHCDHNSQLLFIEQWQAAKGRNVTTPEMTPWRRAHMDNLVDAFDFTSQDLQLPELPTAPTPHRNDAGNYDGSSHCLERYSHPRPPVPYRNSSLLEEMGKLVEPGYKPIRGKLTEGRYLVLEQLDLALAVNQSPSSRDQVMLTKSTPERDPPEQRWVAHATEIGSNIFRLSSVSDGKFFCADMHLCFNSSDAVRFCVDFRSGRGYSFQEETRAQFLQTGSDEKLGWSHEPAYWKLYSVSYSNSAS